MNVRVAVVVLVDEVMRMRYAALVNAAMVVMVMMLVFCVLGDGKVG